MSSYKKLRGLPTDSENIKITRDALFEYCRLDTFAMYAIYENLLETIKRNS